MEQEKIRRKRKCGIKRARKPLGTHTHTHMPTYTWKWGTFCIRVTLFFLRLSQYNAFAVPMTDFQEAFRAEGFYCSCRDVDLGRVVLRLLSALSYHPFIASSPSFSAKAPPRQRHRNDDGFLHPLTPLHFSPHHFTPTPWYYNRIRGQEV